MSTVKRTTIKDVAKMAGVSIATVSFVLNDKPGQVISEAVKIKVFEAAKKLHYHPSASAAGLARKRAGNLAVIFYRCDDLVSNQYYSFVVQGTIKEAMAQGYNLIFAYVNEEYGPDVALPKVVRENNTEGVVFMKQICPDMIRDINARGIPVVAVDCFPYSDSVNTVKVDDTLGGQLAVEHLTSLGHRRIAFLYASRDIPSIAERIEGFTMTMEQRGYAKSAKLLECESFSFEGAQERVKKLLAQKNPPTAIICANDEMAAGAIRGAHQSGFSVPGDISIMGFDNVTMGNYLDPPLTTISPDKEGLGIRAVQLLSEIIRSGATTRTREYLPVTLIARASTGPARSGR